MAVLKLMGHAVSCVHCRSYCRVQAVFASLDKNMHKKPNERRTTKTRRPPHTVTRSPLSPSPKLKASQKVGGGTTVEGPKHYRNVQVITSTVVVCQGNKQQQTAMPPIEQSSSPQYPQERVYGRKREMAQIQDCFQDTNKSKSGKPRVVLVHGSSGCGKTSIVDAFARKISSDPSTSDVIFVRGKSGQFQSRPFQAIADALEQLGRILLLMEQAANQLNDTERLKQLQSVREFLSNEGHLLMRLIPTLTTWGDLQQRREEESKTKDSDEHSSQQDGEPLDTGQSATARMTLALLSLLRGVCNLQTVCLFVDE